MKTLITAGTGLLGRALLASLSDAVVLSRDPARATRQLGAYGRVRSCFTPSSPSRSSRRTEAKLAHGSRSSVRR